MKRLILLLPIAVLALAWWIYRQETAPPLVPFARVERETLVSTLVTNGKVEPIEWVAVRAERPGLVERVHVSLGQQVGKGALLAELSSEDARNELAAAEARILQAQAELEVIESGGRAAELAEMDSALARARMDLEVAKSDLEALRRLAEQNAAPRQEVTEAAQRVERAGIQIRSLEKKRAALVSQEDRTMAQARLREAEAAAKVARRRVEQARIRAPMAGTVYQSEIRPGAYLNPGDLVAKIGQIDKVRVFVYVDEPELGRVSPGEPVTITWDALRGREWAGVVERMPTAIFTLGTRQVGEVLCVIENPGRELLPGTNINAEIRAQVAENALSIPREALRREQGQEGVLVLAGDKIEWRNVRVGAASITRAQILDGLSEGDAVALPSEHVLTPGDVVRPAYR